ncbi:hypothetical protein PF008_g27661 [Phytophthora fragariae]|uniref:Secreted protein n=1 Tax=Phytophthora fragariae TaxID=53985 RepID=A0A6G0QE88_9STRA|nr:hypothetical protein PF008_g27661 [Phytophthora fragariae]
MEPSCLALCPLAFSLRCIAEHGCQDSHTPSSTTAKLINSKKPKTFCGDPDHRQLFHISSKTSVGGCCAKRGTSSTSTHTKPNYKQFHTNRTSVLKLQQTKAWLWTK